MGLKRPSSKTVRVQDEFSIGDFERIFGAAKLNLKIIETPIHYKARTFDETQISRFRDGWPLPKMVWFVYRKLQAI